MNCSRCEPVIAKMCVARSTRVAVKGWLRKLPISTPSTSANVDRMNARKLAANRVHPGGIGLDVLCGSRATAEKSQSHGTSANVARIDKEDVFHGCGTRGKGVGQSKINRLQVNERRQLSALENVPERSPA